MHIQYPDELPVVARKDDISKAIANNQVVIIAGDTGSGKTTQLPKICLELFPDSGFRIGCTQPRRIAASSVSGRVQEELAGNGNLVGYKIRFHDHTTAATRIKFMTDGVLLAETRHDPLLREYGVIILDEAHERSLNIDFLIGYICQLLPKRPDLKVIITSATIDTEIFSRHFNNAPVVSVSGRTFAVDIVYRPTGNEDSRDIEGYVEHCAAEIIRLHKSHPPGDILAFLPTEKDIRTCCNLVAEKLSETVVLPLFGRLQGSDQQKIFRNQNKTKIVIATNVAETSLTVPGISYVVDSGLARMSYYNSRAKTTSLPVQRISQASCDQRKGRCGRIGPGVCIRLYSEEDYHSREPYTLPEIKRANLAEVILQMTSLELGKPEQFPFLDPPQKNAIRDGYKLLYELRAITPDNQLTKDGKFMARLPIDPCISRILLEAEKEHCLPQVMIIASFLAIQDPRIRPADKEKQADAAHQQYSHTQSDFMAILKLWEHYHASQGNNRSWSQLKKYCKANYLSFQRMREWLDLQEQLGRLFTAREKSKNHSKEASYQNIHRALVSGFLRNIAVKKQGKSYLGAGNRELMIFPGSHQFLTAGRWIVAASFLETNRLYGLTVATIEPEWLESLGSHLVRYSWTSPRWSKKRAQVIADERVTLFGLTLVAQRVVNFGKRDQKNIPAAREIFIQSALVEDSLTGDFSFLVENQSLIARWREAEDKLRTTAIVLDDSTIGEFYAQCLPEWVYDKVSLARYIKRQGSKKLLMTEEDVVRQQPEATRLADFPPHLTAGSLQLNLCYSFSPGQEDDGITVRIPVSHAPVLKMQQFEWLVPGLLQEKITFLIKGLPKSLRKHLVPVNLTVDRVIDEVSNSQGSLYHAIEASIHKMFRLAIKRSDWPRKLPDHLQMRFILFDHEGKDLASGRNLAKLIEATAATNNPAATASENIGKADDAVLTRWQNFSTRTWDFKELPASIPCFSPHGEVSGYLYPALTILTAKGHVGIEFFVDQKSARQQNRKGVQYLYSLQFSESYKRLRKYCTSLLSAPSALFLRQHGLTQKKAVEQLLGFVMRDIFPAIDGTIPNREQFDEQLKNVKSTGFYVLAQRKADEAMQVLRKRDEVQAKLHHFSKLDRRKLLFSEEVRAEFLKLIMDILPPDFLMHRHYSDLAGIQRQLQSLLIRIERYYANPAKDKEKMRQLLPHLKNFQEIYTSKDELSPEALELFDRYEQMLGEYRISLFSPEIKTDMPVSAKKLAGLYKELRAKC